ncbi:MAG: hypothetical protein DWQ06_07565 [Calditrichaeota bacterium]|nr:MAG: hypothetical protein DWQ06_07565 [Calditrichota bacterium]
MKKIPYWILPFVIYSLIMLFIDYKYSTSFVRHFFSDITEDNIPFYAINTTISVFLLWGVSLIFAMSLSCLNSMDKEYPRERLFFYSQIFIFAFLGFDDRFLVHELLEEKFGIKDSITLLFFGGLELFSLFFFGKILEKSTEIKITLFLAGAMFGLMIFIDQFWIPEGTWIFNAIRSVRLSAEDLAKTWSGIFLFRYAWLIYSEKIAALQEVKVKDSIQ